MRRFANILRLPPHILRLPVHILRLIHVLDQLTFGSNINDFKV